MNNTIEAGTADTAENAVTETAVETEPLVNYSDNIGPAGKYWDGKQYTFDTGSWHVACCTRPLRNPVWWQIDFPEKKARRALSETEKIVIRSRLVKDREFFIKLLNVLFQCIGDVTEEYWKPDNAVASMEVINVSLKSGWVWLKSKNWLHEDSKKQETRQSPNCHLVVLLCESRQFYTGWFCPIELDRAYLMLECLINHIKQGRSDKELDQLNQYATEISLGFTDCVFDALLKDKPRLRKRSGQLRKMIEQAADIQLNRMVFLRWLQSKALTGDAHRFTVTIQKLGTAKHSDHWFILERSSYDSYAVYGDEQAQLMASTDVWERQRHAEGTALCYSMRCTKAWENYLNSRDV